VRVLRVLFDGISSNQIIMRCNTARSSLFIRWNVFIETESSSYDSNNALSVLAVVLLGHGTSFVPEHNF